MTHLSHLIANLWLKTPFMNRHVTCNKTVLQLILSPTQAAQTPDLLSRVLIFKATCSYTTRATSPQQAWEHIRLTAKQPSNKLQRVLITTRASKRVKVQTHSSTSMLIRSKFWIEGRITTPKKVNYIGISSRSSKMLANNQFAKKKMASFLQGWTLNKTKILTSLRLLLKWRPNFNPKLMKSLIILIIISC